MRAAVLLVLVGVAATAHADDPTSTSATATAEDSAPTLVDPGFHALLEGVGASESTNASCLDLGPQSRAFALGSRWSNEIDANSSGWTVAGGVTRELGEGFKLALTGSFEHLDGRFGGRFSRGSAVSVGARIVRYFHWSRGRVAWLEFWIESTIWNGEAAIAQPAGTFVGLHIGTTF